MVIIIIIRISTYSSLIIFFAVSLAISTVKLYSKSFIIPESFPIVNLNLFATTSVRGDSDIKSGKSSDNCCLSFSDSSVKVDISSFAASSFLIVPG